MTFDPRTMSAPVYNALTVLRGDRQPSNAAQQKELKEQKGQAIELYTYLATWGLLRLKAEEQALKAQKQATVRTFFNCLQTLWHVPDKNVSGNAGLNQLISLTTEEYLGLTGLALALAQEFNFWADAVYPDVDAEGESDNDEPIH